MPELNTTHFGKIKFEESDVLAFPAGLPGFWDATRFLLVPHRNSTSVSYLQSADVPGLRFILVAAFSVIPDYQLAMEPWDVGNLLPPGQTPSRDALQQLDPDIWFIVSVPEPNRLTINMLAPVVIARKARRGVQAVRSDTRYSHAFALDAKALEMARRSVC